MSLIINDLEIKTCIMIQKIKSWFSTNVINKTIRIILLLIVFTIIVQARFNRSEGVIIWDIKSYYAYLPATLIYNDLSFEFMDDGSGKFSKWIWPFESPSGKKAIRASMGMSILYSPFFLVGHLVALLTNYEADGYSRPYHVALNFSAMFYLWLGLLCLARVLRRFFSDNIVAFTLFAVVIGTNLFYYTTREAPMSHSFGFSLFAIFLWLTVRFYEKPSIKRIIHAGLIAGLIALVRPTNIIILLVFFLWGISSFSDFKDRVMFFLKKYYWVLIMAAVFILVWIPQFIYWYSISGKIFYFTYGEKGDSFFFQNPQIFNILFSYKKGWLVYTPIMILAFIGLFYTPKRVPGALLPIAVFKIVNIYILASWWSWWFGGGFGLRAFVESYALMALPMACMIDYAYKQKKALRSIIIGVFVLLIAFNQFQTIQYNNNAIHWWWMNKEAYWETFLKPYPTERFWVVVTLPDYEAARQGIYRELKSPEALKWEERGEEWFTWKKPIPERNIKNWLARKIENDSSFVESYSEIIHEDIDTGSEEAIEQKANELFNAKGYEYWDKTMAIDIIMEEISSKDKMMSNIEEKAKASGISVDSQLVKDAEWLYDKERNSGFL